MTKAGEKIMEGKERRASANDESNFLIRMIRMFLLAAGYGGGYIKGYHGVREGAENNTPNNQQVGTILLL